VRGVRQPDGPRLLDQEETAVWLLRVPESAATGRGSLSRPIDPRGAHRGGHHCGIAGDGRSRGTPAVAGGVQGWSALERAVQRRRLASMVERIDYDGRCGAARVRWRAPLTDGEPFPILLRNHAATQQSPPPQPAESRAGALTGRLPRITRLLALAVRFEGLLQDGTVGDYAELARLGGVSRARITQIMSLRNLAPAIQERILALPAVSSPADVLNERLLRGVAQRWDWREQMRMWEKLGGGLTK
jgi:hypothetical protein